MHEYKDKLLIMFLLQQLELEGWLEYVFSSDVMLLIG